MSATTLTAFVAALRAVSVPGIRRFLPAPPASITTADMPALWLHAAQVKQEPSTRGAATWPALSAELWLIVAPVPQAKSVTAIDVGAELVDVAVGVFLAAPLAKGRPTVTARLTVLGLGDKTYWGAILSVEASG